MTNRHTNTKIKKHFFCRLILYGNLCTRINVHGVARATEFNDRGAEICSLYNNYFT